MIYILSSFFAIFSAPFMKGVIFMTRKQIDGMREMRLWIGQVIVPATAMVMIIFPEAREAAIHKVRNTKENIKNKFKK